LVSENGSGITEEMNDVSRAHRGFVVEKVEYAPVEGSIAPDPNLRMKCPMIEIGQSAGKYRETLPREQ
jgi:hypothetical protein